MCSSTSRGVRPPSFQSQVISLRLGDISVNIKPLSSARDKEKGTKWLQWEEENSILTDGLIIKISLAGEGVIEWVSEWVSD